MHKLYMDLNFSRQGLYHIQYCNRRSMPLVHDSCTITWERQRLQALWNFKFLFVKILCVCLVFFFVYSRIVYWHKDVTIAGEGLQILTFARHTWPLRSEGSLVCHAYCDTGHLFIKVSLQDPWHSQLLPSVWQWSRHYLICRGWEHFGSMVKMDIYQNKVGSILSFQLTSGSGSACVMSILSNGL